MKKYLGLLIVFWVIPVLANEPQPVALIRSTADYVLHQVSERKQELEKDTKGIYALVQEKILPHFDFRLMTRGALGRYWRRATESQKQRLTTEFRELLVRTYATTLFNYVDQKIEYLPFRGQPGDKRVVVSTRIHDKSGPPLPINYRLYRTSTGAWKIYDVVVDGVSLVSSYRNSFASQIRRGGIEGLIESLRKHNAEQAS